MKPCQRSAYTFIELLVVMCLIAVLTTFLLPAVGRVREAALRLHCQNNLRQLALALLNYEATCGCFPPGISTKSDEEDLQYGRATGFHFLLPFFDQDHVHRQWQRQLPWSDAANQVVTEVPIRLLLCSSNGGGGAVDLQRLAAYLDEALPNPAVTDYLFCKGPNANLSPASTLPRSVRGPFDVNSATRIVEIVDGTSNTLAFGEGSAGNAVYTARLTYDATVPMLDANSQMIRIDQGWSMGMVVNGDTAASGHVFGSVLGVTAQRGGFTPPMDEPMSNRLVMAAVDYNQSTDNSDPTVGAFDTLPGFRSLHSGGCNFAFCDGSVRFLSGGVSGATYRAISTIAGRELVAGF